MSIKFVCSCGKRLKARDHMAERRTVCPRCGNPVGIPSLDPNKPRPMTPAERARHLARRPITLSHLDDLEVNEPSALQDGAIREGSPAEKEESVSSTLSSVPRTHDRSPRADSVPRTPCAVPAAPRPAIVPPGSAPTPVPKPRPIDPTIVRLKKERKRHRQFVSRYDWPLEERWYQCVWYPFRAWPLILALAAGLTLLTAATALILPRALREMPLDRVSIPIGLVSSLGPLLALGYVCAFLDCVLASGAAGESRHVRWPGRDLLLVFRSLVAWVLACLSVPAPLAVIGFYYWLNCGDVQVVDWIILAELAAVGAGYWLLAVLAVTQGERLRDANPWRVAELAERLGWRTLIAAVLAGVLFLAHGLLGFWTASVLHENLALGLILAAACWLSWLYWATFVFRVVGVWWHYRSAGIRPGN